MHTQAVVLEAPGSLAVADVALAEPGEADAIVRISHSGVSGGTERLLWEGRMPSFPGMGYPLVPGYEAIGRVMEAGPASGLRAGQAVFVPGSTGFRDVRALFGAAAATLVVPAARVVANDIAAEPSGLLLALAATAHHAIGTVGQAPELVVGHGVVGRLLARLTVALGAPPPTVWEAVPARHSGAVGYPVVDGAGDPRRDYVRIVDASGDAGMLDALIGRLARGGEIVLAGFYAAPLSFAFAPAFMREARLRIAAEWQPGDMAAVLRLVEAGRLSLDGLLSDIAPAAEAPVAYARAFAAPDCLKMALDWS